MQESELLQAQDPLPAPCEVEGGGTAHPAQAEDDRVIARD
jgi:hypothetical protein